MLSLSLGHSVIAHRLSFIICQNAPELIASSGNLKERPTTAMGSSVDVPERRSPSLDAWDGQELSVL